MKTMRIGLGAALALTLGAVGVSAASAADTITPNSYFQGSIYLLDGSNGEAWTKTTNGFEDSVIAIPNPSDGTSFFAIPPGATNAWTFVSPQGSESTPSAWNAQNLNDLAPGKIQWPNVALGNQATEGTGILRGINAVKAAGGDYSLGVAFTTANGLTAIQHSLYYAHIHITAGTGDWTITETAVTKTATTTTVTVPATAPAENAAFSLTAAVAPAAATGNVEFFDGATSLGTAALASGSATLSIAAGLPGGSHSLTAHYAGDTSYAASTSAAAPLTIAGTPVTTTLALTAISTTGFAGSPVVYTATVSPAAATGQVVFSAVKVGDSNAVAIATVPVTAGVATVTSSGLGAGAWTVTGAFAGTGLYQASSTTASLALTVDANSNPSDPDPQTVTVVVPKGTLVITTPYHVGSELALGNLTLNQANSTFELADPVMFASGTDIEKGIKIINARPDQPHFTAQVASTNFTSAGGSFNAGTASLINLASHQVDQNALLATDVLPTDISALANTPQTFAAYAASNLGTAWLSADFDIKGVPSSTPSGLYTATVTFTAV